MINNGDGQHPALDTITRITPIRCASRRGRGLVSRIVMGGLGLAPPVRRPQVKAIGPVLVR